MYFLVNSASIFKKALIGLAVVVVVACSDGSSGTGGGNTDQDQGQTSQTITGGAVDGPVTNADVTLYKINFGETVTSLGDGDVVDRGTTNNQAKIQGLAIPFPLPAAPYAFILEFTANANTKDLTSCTDIADLTTCASPVIKTMRTVVTDEMIARGQNIYATPLTTMATNIALNTVKAGSDYDTNGGGAIDVTEFKEALPQIALQVTSMLGFGLSSDVDIFTTSPIIDESATTKEEQQKVVDYRTAVTSVAAVINQMEGQSGAETADEVLEELTNDMADGEIDGQIDTDGDGKGDTESEIFTETTLDVLEQDPATLPIPNAFDKDNNPIKVADIKDKLDEEKEGTGNQDVETRSDVVVAPKRAQTKPDIDGDGVLNAKDAFPTNPLMDTDTDGDGLPDDVYQPSGSDGNGDGLNDRAKPNAIDPDALSDNDDDNDGWVDEEDDYPKDASRFLDPAEGRDGDSVANGIDNCPFNDNQDQADTDNDGKGDVCDDDNDGDGVADGDDNCPSIANRDQSDTDGTEGGDACDADIDGDNVANESDAFPFDPAESIDTDRDGIGDLADSDDDNDGVKDIYETAGCDLKADCDGDGYFDNADLDDTDPAVTINSAPVAASATITTDEDIEVAVNLVAVDDDGAALTYSLVPNSERNGTVASILENTFTFKPTLNFNGSARFKYRVSDDRGARSNIATVTITVTPLNDVPDATADAIEVAEDAVAAGTTTIGVSDADIGDTHTFAITTAPVNGGASMSADGVVSYTPTTANFYGADSLVVTVTDSASATTTVTVNVTVTPVNDAPVAAANAITVDEDAVVAGTTTINVSDADIGDTHTFAITTAPADGGARVSALGVVSYTPATANFNGTDSLIVTVTDSANATTTATVNVTVTPVNDVPVANNDSVSVRAGVVTDLTTLLGNDIDVEGTALVIDSVGGPAADAGRVNRIDGVVTFDASGLNIDDTAAFEYTVSDGELTSDPATVTVLIVENPTPVAQDGVLNVVEDSTGNAGQLEATDDDPDLTYAVVGTGPANGSVTVNPDGSYLYTPDSDYSGTDSFTFTASDAATTSTAATINITVEAVNDAPAATAGTLTVTEDSTANPGTLNGTDIDGDGLSYAIATGAANGTVTITNANTGAYTYTPNADYSGPDSFSFVANDGEVDSVAAVVDITVEAVNDAPTATADAIAVDEDAVVAGTTAINVTDADSGDTHTFTLTTAPASGSASVDAAGGVVSYTPTIANFNGTDSLVVTVTDSAAESTTVTVNITVKPVNDDPVATDDSYSTTIGSVITLNVLANDNDLADGDTLSISAVSAANGSIENNGTDLTYTAPEAAGTDTFTYTVSDGNGGFVTASVAVTVTEEAAVVDATGVWIITSTVTDTVDLAAGGGGCDVQIGDVDVHTVTITQDETDNLVMKSATGEILNGIIDTSGSTPGAFSLSGTYTETLVDIALPADTDATETYSDVITIAGNSTGEGAGSTMTGTMQITRSWKGDKQCDVAHSINGEFVYRHNGTEDYSGVYAIEEAGFEEGNSIIPGISYGEWREGLPMQFTFDAVAHTVSVVIPEDNTVQQSFSNASFDPMTGFFRIEMHEQQFDDRYAVVDGGFVEGSDGIIDYAEDYNYILTGIVMRDPSVTKGTDGEPVMATAWVGSGRVFDGDYRVGGGSPYEAVHDYAKGYGKILDTVGMTRTALITEGDGSTRTDILVGLLNAPVKANGGELYLQVMAPDDVAELCSAPYFDTAKDVGDGRYFEQIVMPHPDMTAFAFRGDTYSSVSCNTTGDGGVEVNAGDVLPVRVIDAGPDKMIGGGDDTVMYNTTLTAKPVVNAADRYTAAIGRHELSVNGAKASRTQSGKVIELPGYFNLDKDIPVSWPAHNEGADGYRLILPQDGFINHSYETAGGAASVILPGGTYDFELDLRLAAVKNDANDASALAYSRQVNIRHGIRGIFNFEMGNGVPLTFQSFPVFIEASAYGGFCQVAPGFSFYCDYASVDFENDTVTLGFTDGDGSVTGTASNTFELVMHFSDSANAEVTSPTGLVGVPDTPQGEAATTSARVAKSEVVMQTVHKSHNGVQYTQLKVTTPNPVYDNVFMQRADGGLITHSDGGINTGIASVPIWNSNDGTGSFDIGSLAGIYTLLDANDGKAGSVIALARNHSNNWKDSAGTEMGDVIFDPGQYEVVMENSLGSYPPAIIHRVDFPALDGTSYAAPSGDSIVLNSGTADEVDCSVTICTDGNPGASLDLPNGLNSISWPVGAYPADARFKIVFKHIATEYEMRTNWMTDGTESMTVNAGIATWAPDYEINAPGGNYEVSFRVDNGDGAGVVGVSTANTGFSNSDRLYITINSDAVQIALSDYFHAGVVGDTWDYQLSDTTQFTMTLANAASPYVGKLEKDNIVYDVVNNVMTWYTFEGGVLNPVLVFPESVNLGQEVSLSENDSFVIIKSLTPITVPAGTYNDVYIMLWLDSAFSPNSVNTEFGLADYGVTSAVTDVEYFVPGIGWIKYRGIDAATGESDGGDFELTATTVIP